MFSYNERVKSAFFQCFREYIRAYAFVADDGGNPEFHLLPSLHLGDEMCPAAPFDCLSLMSSSQCGTASRVQDLFQIARCRYSIMAV